MNDEENAIALTDEDMNILYGLSAKAAFTSAVAGCFLALAGREGGAGLQEFLLKQLQESLKRVSSPSAPFPMSQDDRDELRQYYRLFLAYYRDPNRLENLPSDARRS